MNRVKRKKIKRVKRCYYVYALCYPDGSPFYIGKGKGNRAYLSGEDSRASFKTRIINKIKREGGKVKVSILHSNLTEATAFEKEIELIKRYGRRNINTGTLCNLTTGGEGASGNFHSKESRKKQSSGMKRAWARGDSKLGTPSHIEKQRRISKALYKDPIIAKKYKDASARRVVSQEARDASARRAKLL